jgi:GNAT superfamily N-acetyltransferase
MIRTCGPDDLDEIWQVIDQAAVAYRDAIPDDCYHDPYMPREELEAESREMTFFGWEEKGALVGVMGFQPLADAPGGPPSVTLIRHAYVLPSHQRRGIAGRLLSHLIGMATTPRLLVGTWRDASWAIAFYEKHGFRLLPDGDRLLRTYWRIPDRQRETSVVLGRGLQQA